MNYPNVEQFETRDRELRADLRLLRELRAARGPAAPARARPATVRQLVTLRFARDGGR